MYSDKQRLGIILEKLINAIMVSLDYRTKHVDWDNYTSEMGNGQDIRVFNGNRQVCAVECKNWRKLNKPYGTETVKTEIIERFVNFAGGIKILVISFLSLFTKEAIRLLKANNIHIVEIGKLIGSKDFRTQLFYQVKAKIRSLLESSTTSRFVVNVVNNNPITNYVCTNNLNTSKTKEHDTEVNYQLAKDIVRQVKLAILLEKLPHLKGKEYMIPNNWLE